MSFSAKKFYGLGIYKKWHCQFPIDKLVNESNIGEAEISEKRIEQLAKRIPLKEKRILELGSLEGIHSFMLQSQGAGEVIAVEGRRDNFLKCLLVKNAFKLDKCRFLFGDIADVLPSLSSRFDICVALGVFYHVPNPIAAIDYISKLTDTLFLWTHYAEDFPKRTVEIKYGNNIYRGKYVKEDVRHYLSGLQKKSFWLTKDSLLKALDDFAFKNIEIVEKEKHEHGPAITVLARK